MPRVGPDAVPHTVQRPPREAVPLTGPAGGGAQVHVVLVQYPLLEDLAVHGDRLGAAVLIEQQGGELVAEFVGLVARRVLGQALPRPLLGVCGTSGGTQDGRYLAVPVRGRRFSASTAT